MIELVRRTSGPLAPVLRSGGARLLVLPVSAGLGLLTTRALIEGFGDAVYAQYGLLVALGAALPFADLGLSAAVVEGVGSSEDPGADPLVRGILVTALRVLVASCLLLLVVDAAITATGGWEWLLGSALLSGSGPVAAAGCLAAIALGMPLSIGQRVLTGLGRHHVVVLVLGAQTPIVLLVVLAVRHAGGDGELLAVVPYVAVALLMAVLARLSATAASPAVVDAVRTAPRLRTVRGARVMHLAWPMLVQLVAVPLAMQTDRVVLSHVDGGDAVAHYNLAAQLYLPVWQVVNAAGLSLWPRFARARAEGRAGGERPFHLAAGFAATAAVAVGAITASAPWLVRLASGGELELPLALTVSFAVLMVVQAAKYPLGMFLTDQVGLRFQAAMVLVMAPVNLALSIALSGPFGAAGPVLGSIVGVALFELGANSWLVRRRLTRSGAPPRSDVQQATASASTGVIR